MVLMLLWFNIMASVNFPLGKMQQLWCLPVLEPKQCHTRFLTLLLLIKIFYSVQQPSRNQLASAVVPMGHVLHTVMSSLQ